MLGFTSTRQEDILNTMKNITENELDNAVAELKALEVAKQKAAALENTITRLAPKTAIEIVPGKKYLAVINGVSEAEIAAYEKAAPVIERCFTERGIDLTLFLTRTPLELYELEAKVRG